MTRTEMKRFAEQKIAEYLKADWRVVWLNSKNKHGHCNSRKRELAFSRYAVTLPEEEQVDLVLHELAHALDYERRGRSAHDYAWKSVCLEVGAKPQRVASVEMDVPFKYTVHCVQCGKEYLRHRITRGVRYGTHVNCGGYFDWEQHY